MKTAGEGGAWGIAALALFTLIGGGDLEEYIDKLFANAERTTVSADAEEIDSFSTFMEVYYKGLAVQKLAGEIL
jgi:sugar (pentulose or hexulose) kinase